MIIATKTCAIVASSSIFLDMIMHYAVLKLRLFRSPHFALCLSEETLKVVGPFYLVSMPGEVNDTGKCNLLWTLQKPP